MIYDKCLNLLQIKLVGEQCVSFCTLCSVRSHHNQIASIFLHDFVGNELPHTEVHFRYTKEMVVYFVVRMKQICVGHIFPFKMYVKNKTLLVGGEHKFRQITLSKIFQIQNSPVSQFTYSLSHNGTWYILIQSLQNKLNLLKMVIS